MRGVRSVRRLAAMGLGALVAASAAIGEATAGPEQPTIRVAVEGAYPPFNYIENNELTGFEVDLLKALCDEMRTRCNLVQHDWEGIIRGLLNRDYDAIFSSLEITDRRQKRIIFSRRYYFIPPALLGPKDATLPAVTPDALAGLRIGAVDRSEHASYVQNVLKGAELTTYGKLEEANLDLIAGRLDFVIADKLALTKFVNSREGACCSIVADVPPDPAFFGHGFGVGLRPQDEDLKRRFDDAIAKLMADGTYDRIRAKYFPFDIK